MPNIFTLDIKCIAGMYLIEPYEFNIQVPTDWTLADLADCILRTLDFDGDHLSQFCVAASPRGGKTLLDSGESTVLRLDTVFPLPKHKKLFYLYDFGASWWFQISKKGKLTAALPSVEYPRLLAEHGTKPLEYGADDDWD